MKKNIGQMDKVVRLSVALAILVLYSLGIVSGTVGLVFLTLAALLALTSLFGFCGLYTLLGISTCPMQKGK